MMTIVNVCFFLVADRRTFFWRRRQMVVSKFQIKNCTTNSVNVVDTFFANKFTVYDSDENNEKIGQSPYDSNGPESQNKQADKGRENRGKYKSRQLLLKWQCSFRCSMLKTFLLVSSTLWFLIFKRNFEVKKSKKTCLLYHHFGLPHGHHLMHLLFIY